MVILHIAHINNSTYSGVSVVVPLHMKFQNEYATTGLLNINNQAIHSLNSIMSYNDNFDINKLPTPYNKPDIVIIHEVYYKEYLKIWKNLKQNHIPYIIVPHGCLTAAAQNKKKIKKIIANTLCFRKFINNSVALQCLSEGEKQNTIFHTNKFIGTNGVSLPTNKKTYFSKTEKKFVYIGRLDSYPKGIDLMIKAIKIKKDFLKKNNCKFFIYGPDYKNRRKIVEKLIDDNNVQDIVTISNAVSGTEKERILVNADIFIQTSRVEGMPLGILEALSYGIPCLITKGTNLGDYVENYDAGWVAETKSVSIANKIVEAISDDNIWMKKSQNCISLIEKEFSWEEISKQTVEEYKRRV